MSDSVRPHRRQPTRLLCPWDSPGKNTGVGCHFLLQCMKMKSESEIAQLCPTLSNPMDCSLPGSSVHGIFQARILEWVAIGLLRFLSLHIKKKKKKMCLPYPKNNKKTGRDPSASPYFKKYTEWIIYFLTSASIFLHWSRPKESFWKLMEATKRHTNDVYKCLMG